MTEFNEYVTPRLEVHDSDIESEFKQNHIVYMVTLKLDTPNTFAEEKSGELVGKRVGIAMRWSDYEHLLRTNQNPLLPFVPFLIRIAYVSDHLHSLFPLLSTVFWWRRIGTPGWSPWFTIRSSRSQMDHYGAEEVQNEPPPGSSPDDSAVSPSS